MAVNFALFSDHLCNFQSARSMHKLAFRAIILTLADQERNHILLLHHIQTHSLIDLVLVCTQQAVAACSLK